MKTPLGMLLSSQVRARVLIKPRFLLQVTSLRCPDLSSRDSLCCFHLFHEDYRAGKLKGKGLPPVVLGEPT